MKRALLSLLLLTCAATAWAQWSGSVDLGGGYGRLTGTDGSTPLHHGLGNGTFKLVYKSPTFQWNTTLGGSYETVTTESYRLKAVATQNQEDGVQLSSAIKTRKSSPWALNFRSDAIWTPSAQLRHHAWVLYGYKREKGDNLTYEFSGVNQVEMTGIYFDLPEGKTHQVEAGYDITRTLGSPRRVLLGSASLSQVYSHRQTQWLVYEEKQDSPEYMNVYAILPSSVNTSFKATVHLRDSILTSGPVRLMLDPGLRLGHQLVKDRNSGATLVSEDPVVWKDSTSLREDFRFFTVTAEPYLAANLRWDKLMVHADYGLQFYARRLTSDLHPVKDLDFVKPSLVGNLRAEWTFPSGNSLLLGNTLSVKHPDYLQICWYERQGTYLTQVYRGSETLESTHSYAFNLTYKYKHKNWRANVTATASRRLGAVEQTYTNEEIGGVSCQVFTWINASDSWTLSLAPQAGWTGKWFKTNAGVSYNHSFLTSRISGERKQNSDWGVWADASFTLKKGWQADADIRYHSSVSTFFTSFSEYWTLNVKVQKSFGRLVLYLQGRDLLDNPVINEYLSADQLEWWTEESRLNRRLIILGGKWSF